MADNVKPLFEGSEPVPADAIVLFDGKDFSQWMHGDGSPVTWPIKDGYATTANSDICTKQKFKDCQLHVEFWLPLMADSFGQGRANSGVFFQGFTYEIQVLDSYGLDSLNNDCGGVYSIFAPIVNACRRPEQWQTYDVIFHAARFNDKGKKVANARVTVLQNGVLIHDNIEIPFPTPSREMPEPQEADAIQLQYHGNDVRFRNVWIRPL